MKGKKVSSPLIFFMPILPPQLVLSVPNNKLKRGNCTSCDKRVPKFKSTFIKGGVFKHTIFETQKRKQRLMGLISERGINQTPLSLLSSREKYRKPSCSLFCLLRLRRNHCCAKDLFFLPRKY